MTRSFLTPLWIIVAASVVVLTFANIEMGELNQDEGWYLYAAGEVSRGHMPYRDFAFTQGPMLPLVYSLAQPMVDAWGVSGGRLFTAFLGLVSAGLAGALAARLSRQPGTGALLGFTLAAVNVYQSYFTTVVKTYALCAFFLVLGLLLLESAARRRSALLSVLAGAALAFAAATRITAGAALAVGGFYLLFRRKSLGNAPWIAFGCGGALGLAGAFVPFYLAGREGFIFGMFEYHKLRSAGSLAQAIVYKAGFVSRLVQAYYLAAALGVAVLFARWLKPWAMDEEDDAKSGFGIVVWLTVLAVTAVQFTAPVPYDDYEVPVYPLFAAALAAALLRVAGSGYRVQAWLAVAVVLAGVASAFSSPLNQSWMIRGRDRIWWRMREQTAMQQLRDAALTIKAHARPGDQLLTQDTYLAVEAGLRVPPGLEMGPFSYYRDLDRKRAEALHVVNREMLDEILVKAEAPVCALSGYSLSIKAPEVDELPADEQAALRAQVEQRYGLVRSIPNFGQGATTLDILVRKTEPAAP